MQLMLALKRKRQVDGKDTRFQYNGHEIDEERIERACKRHKGLLYAPTGAQSQCLTHVQCNNVLVEVPAYVTALTPPCQSSCVMEQNAAFDHGIFSFSTTSSAFFGPTLESKDPALMTDIGRGVDPGSVQAFDIMDATTMIDAQVSLLRTSLRRCPGILISQVRRHRLCTWRMISGMRTCSSTSLPSKRQGIIVFAGPISTGRITSTSHKAQGH